MNWRRILLGQKHQGLPKRSDRSPEQQLHAESNTRRGYSRVTLLAALLLVLYSIFVFDRAEKGITSFIVATGAIVWAIWFYFVAVISIPFITSAQFKPNGQRLAIDTLISGLFWIIACGYFHSLVGLEPSGKAGSVFDYYYFSTVTFSTLGYGDFSPTEVGRLLAAAQAIIGNLHLGVLVAAAFLVASNIENS